jgi:hypothetical protein
MDNLERAPASVQTFPNPGQRDGRNGGWSWYPVDRISAGIVEDDSNRALAFSGSELGAFAGATLAFLGGNGGGACYDASLYEGIRFRIRGSAQSPDALDGKVVISLITAETRPRRFGGDLDGEGGHFSAQVTLTSEWQTVSLSWSDFATPTWGSTLTLSEPALTKLQAIDWGVSNLATGFDVQLDDVALY